MDMSVSTRIDGLNYNAISSYNNYLKGSASFNVNYSFSDFDKILNEKTESGKKTAGETESFANNLGKSITAGLTSVSDAKHAADKAQEILATGGDVSVHDVMIAAEKASLSMQMAVQLRNRMISAYTEITNMAI